MNRIIWKDDRFECSSPELEDAKWQVLASNHLKLRDFMVCCDLRLDEFICHADRSITILRLKEDLSFAEFPIAKEGTGFNICFHLGAYAIASINLGQKLEICAYSFKNLLHPLLFERLGEWFGDHRSEEIDKKCPYYSGDLHLKCAVNPSLPCSKCSEVSESFKESLFVWRTRDLNDYLNPDLMEHIENVAMRGSGLEAIREAFILAAERAPSMIKIPYPAIGVDLGSGQDATAIATVSTNADGSTVIRSLEIRDLPPEVEAAIANIRARAAEILDHNFQEACQCGINLGTPLLPRLKEEHQKYTEARRRARIWSQFSGIQIQPQPYRMPIPQELYGVLEDKTND